jgi:tetratricopeptide (TPR) repeat protein
MIEGRLRDDLTSLPQVSISQILKLAKKSHENYLVRSSVKDLETAVSYYIEAMKIDPSIPEPYCRLASLLWEKGQIDTGAALKECRKAVKIDPESSVARLYLGYFLKVAEKFDEAESELLTAVKMDGIFSSKARVALGLTIIQKARSCRSDFKDIIRGLHYFASGMLLMMLDVNAIRVFARSFVEELHTVWLRLNGSFHKRFKNYDEAIKVYENAAERTGKSVFYSEIGDLSVEAGNHIQAIEYYKKSLESAPDNSVLWTKLVNILQNSNSASVEEIKNCYNHIIELEPDNARIYYELGHLYLQLYDRFSTLNAFKKAVELEPDNAFYHNSLAYSYVQLEDYNNAILEYQKAIKLNPENTWTSIVSQALGAIYHQVKNNIEAAIVAYQTSIVLDPFNVDAYIALGEVYQETNDLTNAIDCYCEVLKLDPNIAKVYCNLGAALWEKDYIEESIVAYNKAVTLDPMHSYALNNLGVIYLDGSGKPDEALINFTRAIKSNPNFALAYYNKARAYQAIDNKMSAARYYQMAIDINKLTDELDEEEAQERLHQLFAV